MLGSTRDYAGGNSRPFLFIAIRVPLGALHLAVNYSLPSANRGWSITAFGFSWKKGRHRFDEELLLLRRHCTTFGLHQRRRLTEPQ